MSDTTDSDAPPSATLSGILEARFGKVDRAIGDLDKTLALVGQTLETMQAKEEERHAAQSKRDDSQEKQCKSQDSRLQSLEKSRERQKGMIAGATVAAGGAGAGFAKLLAWLSGSGGGGH